MKNKNRRDEVVEELMGRLVAGEGRAQVRMTQVVVYMRMTRMASVRMTQVVSVRMTRMASVRMTRMASVRMTQVVSVRLVWSC